MAFEVYVLFENLSTVGKYITNLYTADGTSGDDLKLPSGSSTYTLPGASDEDEKEAYLIKMSLSLATQHQSNISKFGSTTRTVRMLLFLL